MNRDITKEQFIQICTDYGFLIKELEQPWQVSGKWYVAYIPNTRVPVAAHIPENKETNVCVQLDCFYDGPVHFQTRKTCQPDTIEKFKFFLGEVNKTVKNHIVNMKISKMLEEDF